jgi:hypothetical protein
MQIQKCGVWSPLVFCIDFVLLVIVSTPLEGIKNLGASFIDEYLLKEQLTCRLFS